MKKLHLFLFCCIIQRVRNEETIEYNKIFRIKEFSLLDNLTAKKLRTEDLIKKNGYPVEVHEVETPDDFILTLHRIPRGAREIGNLGAKKAVLVYHGIFSSSADWLMNGVNGSLAYILADAGYDVWLGNFRGNTYSDKHLHLNKTNRNYWDWTFHEIGKYDIPTVIDYILNIKNDTDLYYVGFSLGSTSFNAGMAINPQYNKKIKLAIGLGPTTFVHNWVTPLGIIAPGVFIHEFFSNLVDDPVISPEFWVKLLRRVSPLLCRVRVIAKRICSNIMFLLFGFDRPQLDLKKLPHIFMHIPAPMSSKNVVHIFQMRNRETFGLFDYGPKENLILYGQSTPPDYDISKITCKYAIIWGKNDWIGDPKDVDILAQKLPNLVYYEPVPYEKFNHMDFMYATDVKKLVYDTIVSLIKQN